MASSLFIWSGISAAALIILVLALPRENTAKTANRILAGLVTVITLNLVPRFLSLSNQIADYSAIKLLHLITTLMIGPCLLFYVLELTGRSRLTAVHLKWHMRLMLPLLVAGFAFIAVHVLGILPEPNPGIGVVRIASIVSKALMTASLLAYSLYSLYLIDQHRNRIEHHFSQLESINLRWLQSLCWALIVVAFSRFIIPPEDEFSSYWQGMFYVGLIYYMGYMGIRQPAIFHQRASFITDLSEQDYLDDEAARAVSNLPGDSEQIWDRLQSRLDSDQLFRQNTINLARLAEQIDVHPNRLSAVINHHAGNSFFDLINARRVEYAKGLLVEDDKGFSILDIAMESGFNSKSAFYAQFKKYTRMTPTDYRKRGN